MALTQRQHAVLAEMGIPVWQQRVREVAPSSPTEAAETVITHSTAESAEVTLNGRCVLVVPSLPLAETEQSLLSAMLKCVGLSLAEVDLLDDSTAEQMTAESLQGKSVWFMGTNSRTDSDFMSLQSDSLNTLLAEPAAKGRAWQTLKQLARQLS
jgi:DNA polymerase III psi subunit